MKLDYRGLAILAGLFTSFVIFLDSLVLHTVLPDIYTLAILGSWIGVILTILFASLAGKRLDREYNGLFKISGRSTKYAILAGILSAAITFVYLYVAKIYDPSLMAPLLPIVLIFMVLRDMIVEKEQPAISELSSIFMVLAGAVLVAFRGGTFDLLLIFLIVIIHNGINALTSHFQKLGMRAGTDSINFRLITAIVIAIAMTVYSLPRAELNFDAIVHALPLVSASMFFVFLSMIAYLTSLKDGKLSVVYSLNLSYVIFSTALTVVVSIIWPGIFPLQAAGTGIAIKLIGTALIVVGILALVLGETYVYLFIKTKSEKSGFVFQKLSELPEVVSAYQVFGTKNVIAKVRVKLVGKMENTISQKIMPIDGVVDIERLNLIKEQ